MDSSIDLSLLQKEVLVSSDQSGQYWNVCIWDYNSGTNLQTYKNCGTVSHGLEFLRNDYMICAIYNKPYLNYFNLKGKTQQAKINTSSCVNCLAASSCGNYMALGIEDKVFLLETHSGRVATVIAKHFQYISVIKFAMNDRYLITGSNDSVINVWNLNELLNTDSALLNPVHCWNSHTMSINDLYVSLVTDKVISVSQDQTCKFWSINSDSSMPENTITFQAIANRCIMDHLESNLYVGLINGVILCLPIKVILNDSNKMIIDSMNLNKSFIGHTKKINCLSISLDDFTMASGSDDANIRVWDTQSRQCLKIINQNGPVTNCCFKLRTIFYNDEPNVAPTLFTRYISDGINKLDGKISIKTGKSDLANRSVQLEDFLFNGHGDRSGGNGGGMESLSHHLDHSKSFMEDFCQDEYFELKYKYENVKKINEKIYSFAVEKIINNNNNTNTNNGD